jgi:glucose-6-phosphate 1-dehydrogenase
VRQTLVVLGGSGDLTGRLLLPALAVLADRGELADDLDVLAVSQQPWDDETYRSWARERLAAHAGDLPSAVRDQVVRRLGHHPGDVTAAGDLRAALDRAAGVPVVYLALPNTAFLPAVQALADADLPVGARLVVEKPFGRDQADARRLNELLDDLVGEDAVYRVDLFLAEHAALQLLGLRFANRVFETVWNADSIAAVDIVYDEVLALEGRAGYYDTAGALRDMLQNHLLQVLALVAMEPPASFDAASLRVRRTEVLRAVRPPADASTGSARGRYTAGTLRGRPLPDYTSEEGVDPARDTETFAAVVLTVDNPRWTGVPFRLRSGKALGTGQREVVVRFRPDPSSPFPSPAPDVLRLAFHPAAIRLDISVSGLRGPFELQPTALVAPAPGTAPPPYARVLHEVLTGAASLSVSAAEAEEQWRVVEPVLSAWAAGEVPLQEYPAGSDGPVSP